MLGVIAPLTRLPPGSSFSPAGRVVVVSMLALRSPGPVAFAAQPQAADTARGSCDRLDELTAPLGRRRPVRWIRIEGRVDPPIDLPGFSGGLAIALAQPRLEASVGFAEPIVGADVAGADSRGGAPRL
jgi:hypothetical protein